MSSDDDQVGTFKLIPKQFSEIETAIITEMLLAPQCDSMRVRDLRAIAKKIAKKISDGTSYFVPLQSRSSLLWRNLTEAEKHNICTRSLSGNHFDSNLCQLIIDKYLDVISARPE